jgi:hypothetical protein
LRARGGDLRLVPTGVGNEAAERVEERLAEYRQATFDRWRDASSHCPD